MYHIKHPACIHMWMYSLAQLYYSYYLTLFRFVSFTRGALHFHQIQTVHSIKYFFCTSLPGLAQILNSFEIIFINNNAFQIITIWLWPHTYMYIVSLYLIRFAEDDAMMMMNQIKMDLFTIDNCLSFVYVFMCSTNFISYLFFCFAFVQIMKLCNAIVFAFAIPILSGQQVIPKS